MFDMRNIKRVLFFSVLWLTVSTEAYIYVDGQLYSGETLNITDSSYNSVPIVITDNSVVNIYYQDEYIQQDSFSFYQPQTKFYINASGDSVINFFIPEDDNPDFSFYLWDTDDIDPIFVDVYPGLQLNPSNYPIASYSELWRFYGGGVDHVLSPQIGIISLNDDANIIFIPEPTTIFLLSFGSLLISIREK
jgi:hypothetical protein